MGRILAIAALGAVAVTSSPLRADVSPASYDSDVIEQNLLISVEQALGTGFDMVDRDGDGKIGREDLLVFASDREIPSSEIMSAESFDRMDLDQDGVISREEFLGDALSAYKTRAGL